MNNVQKHLEKAIENNVEFSDAHYELGLILMEKGENEIAQNGDLVSFIK